MSIYFGNNKIGKIYVGGTSIGKVYKGSELVWQKNTSLKLYCYSKYDYDYDGTTTVLYAYLLGAWADSSYMITGGLLYNPPCKITQINGTLGASGSSVRQEMSSYPGSYRKTVTVNNVKIHIYGETAAVGQSAILGNPWYFIMDGSVVGNYLLVAQGNYNGLYMSSSEPRIASDSGGASALTHLSQYDGFWTKEKGITS